MPEALKLHDMFIESARTWITELEDNLLTLEKFPRDKESINSIFRIAHNLKGASGNVELVDINRFAHSIEDLLDLIRSNKLIPDRKVIDYLLEAADLISEMVEAAAINKQFDFARCQFWITRANILKRKDFLP